MRATAHVGVAVGRRCALELNTVPPGDIKVKPDWSAISWWDSHLTELVFGSRICQFYFLSSLIKDNIDSGVAVGRRCALELNTVHLVTLK